jgi:hypothetical protein
MDNDTSPGGHHPVYTGIQNHSMGECYPLAVVGYGHNPTLYVVENLAEGTVLCCTAEMWGTAVYHSSNCEVIRDLMLAVHKEGAVASDRWVKGRPMRTADNILRL